MHRVPKGNMRYVQAFGNYVKVNTIVGTLVVRKTLQEFASEMSDTLTRIHKSHLVSKNHIQSIWTVNRSS